VSELLVPGCDLFAYVVELLGHQALARWDSGAFLARRGPLAVLPALRDAAGR
jgi:hypothetical protein